MKKPKRNAAETREKLLEAATEEFAANGLAGGRIDRIAKTAGVSKPMLYNYFGDKESLFDAVLMKEVMAAADSEPFDATDIAGYAGRTYDLLAERPRLWRMLIWHHLERGLDIMALPAGQGLLRDKQENILISQQEGRLNSDFGPIEVVRLVAHLSQLWCTAEPARTAADHKSRRETVIRAVTCIIDPKKGPNDQKGNGIGSTRKRTSPP